MKKGGTNKACPAEKMEDEKGMEDIVIAKKKGSFFRKVYKQRQLFLIMAIPLLFYLNMCLC